MEPSKPAKLGGNDTTLLLHHPTILCHFANYAHHKTLYIHTLWRYAPEAGMFGEKLLLKNFKHFVNSFRCDFTLQIAINFGGPKMPNFSCGHAPRQHFVQLPPNSKSLDRTLRGMFVLSLC